MRYIHYDVEDFANDLKFREWVLEQNPDVNFFWEKWALNNPEKNEILEKARILVSTLRYEEAAFSEKDKARLLARIEEAIAKKESVVERKTKVLPMHRDIAQSQKKGKGKNTAKGWWLRAAVILIGLVASAVFVARTITGDQLQGESKISLIEKENLAGRRSVVLPDGSIVVLNAKSKVIFPSAFADTVREVVLSGEAFFDVVKDDTKPFIVKTNGLSTYVLGTTFNVKAYPDAPNAIVCLVSGKVLIKKNTGNEKAMMLLPGEAVDLNKEKDVITKGAFNYMEDIAWKDGTLYLNATPLPEVFDRMESWYGVTFHYGSLPKKMKSISGSFKNETLDNMLHSISYTVNFDYKIEGENVIVEFK